MATSPEIFEIVRRFCRHGEPRLDETSSPHTISVDRDDVRDVCVGLLNEPSTYFDVLSCLTVVDNGPDAQTMEVIYNLYSIPFNHHLMLKVVLSRHQLEIASVSSVWKTADWHEREAFDLFGVRFKDHPDLRRILLPADWEGYPLRKDYEKQKYYRDIKLDY